MVGDDQRSKDPWPLDEGMRVTRSFMRCGAPWPLYQNQVSSRITRPATADWMQLVRDPNTTSVWSSPGE
jgi:hypothetical protein